LPDDVPRAISSNIAVISCGRKSSPEAPFVS
jgi:hypothetical protein